MALGRSDAHPTFVNEEKGQQGSKTKGDGEKTGLGRCFIATGNFFFLNPKVLKDPPLLLPSQAAPAMAWPPLPSAPSRNTTATFGC